MSTGGENGLLCRSQQLQINAQINYFGESALFGVETIE